MVKEKSMRSLLKRPPILHLKEDWSSTLEAALKINSFLVTLEALIHSKFKLSDRKPQDNVQRSNKKVKVCNCERFVFSLKKEVWAPFLWHSSLYTYFCNVFPGSQIVSQTNQQYQIIMTSSQGVGFLASNSDTFSLWAQHTFAWSFSYCNRVLLHALQHSVISQEQASISYSSGYLQTLSPSKVSEIIDL